VNIPKITILVDHGYHPETISQALQVYPQILTKIRFERSPKPKLKSWRRANLDLLQLPDGWLNARMLDGTLQVPGQKL